jgi:predicted dehydrogenase
MVCISLPNNLHEEAVNLCCKHKKAVMTTKPLGRNAEEAYRMLKAVETAGIFNGYLEDLVYTPKFLKAHESVKNGALGRILWAKSGKRILARTVIGFGILNWLAAVAF